MNAQEYIRRKLDKVANIEYPNNLHSVVLFWKNPISNCLEEHVAYFESWTDSCLYCDFLGKKYSHKQTSVPYIIYHDGRFGDRSDCCDDLLTAKVIVKLEDILHHEKGE